MLKIIDHPKPAIVQTQYEKYRFAKIEDIVYIQMHESHTMVHLADKTKFLSRVIIKDYYQKLKDYHFYYANRRNLFNLLYLKSLYSDKVKLVNDVELKLSRRHRQSLIHLLNKY